MYTMTLFMTIVLNCFVKRPAESSVQAFFRGGGPTPLPQPDFVSYFVVNSLFSQRFGLDHLQKCPCKMIYRTW